MLVRSLLSAALLCSTIQAQSVVVVDDDSGPGVDFTQISDAIAGSPSGTLILVKSGSYGAFEIDEMEFAVVADTDQQVVVQGSTVVKSLDPGQDVDLIGLTFGGANASGSPALFTNTSFGRIKVNRCTIEGGFGELGMRVRDCESVTLTQCEITGGHHGGEGLLIDQGSTVYGFHTDVTGGAGIGGLSSFDPGVAVRLEHESVLSAVGGTFQGGRGGDGSDAIPCVAPFDGAAALQLGTSDPTALLRDVALVGGEGGSSVPCSGTLASPGEEVILLAGTVEELDGPARGYSIPSVARAGEVAELSFEGGPGEICFWLLSGSSSILHSDLAVGGLIQFDLFANFGSLPASGTLTVPPTVPDFGIDFGRLYEQAVYFSAEHGFLVGDTLTSVILGPGF